MKFNLNLLKMNKKKLSIKRIAIGILTLFSFVLHAQTPKPSDVFGFKLGDDYKLASYDQMLDYYEKLEGSSDRIKKIEIGETTQGRPMVLLMISSKENLKELDHWKEISRKLAKARIDSIEAQK